MVGFESVNGKATNRPFPEGPLANYLEGVAMAMGFAARPLPIDAHSHNLLITSEVRPGDPWLLFESHMDTVTLEGMTVEPLKGEVRDGKMYGRGSCDTKGTGACMIWALKQYVAQKDRPNNIAVLFTTDEESFKTGIRAFAAKQMAGLGWRPAGAIVGEPTMLQPLIAHNGMVRWKIRTAGVAAHSSAPSRGKSAISAMVKVVDAIESRYIPHLTASHFLTGKAVCSINIIRGGVQLNVIPDSCTIDIDRRIVPGEDLDAVIPEVEKILNDLRRQHPGLEVSQDPPYKDLPFDASKSSPQFTNWVRAAVREIKQNDEPFGMPYGTDACLFSEANIPCVVIGPGDMTKAHTKDEFVDLAQIPLGIEFYQRLMQSPMPG